MKTNLSVKLNALFIVLLVAIMAMSVFSVVFADTAKKDYVNVLEAEDGEYAIEYDTKGMAQGAKYFYNIAIVEKKGRKYNLTLLQKGSDVKMNEMRIEKPKVINAKTTPDGDKVRYVFENVPKSQLEGNIKCSTFVPKMNFRPPFELKIDMTKGMKFDNLDTLLGEAPNPDDVKPVMPTGMIVGIVVMVVVVLAVIAVVVVVIVKKSKKKSAVVAVVEEAKAETPAVENAPVEEAPVVEETPTETPAEEPAVEDKTDEPKED